MIHQKGNLKQYQAKLNMYTELNRTDSWHRLVFLEPESNPTLSNVAGELEPRLFIRKSSQRVTKIKGPNQLGMKP